MASSGGRSARPKRSRRIAYASETPSSTIGVGRSIDRSLPGTAIARFRYGDRLQQPDALADAHPSRTRAEDRPTVAGVAVVGRVALPPFLGPHAGQFGRAGEVDERGQRNVEELPVQQAP